MQRQIPATWGWHLAAGVEQKDEPLYSLIEKYRQNNLCKTEKLLQLVGYFGPDIIYKIFPASKSLCVDTQQEWKSSSVRWRFRLQLGSSGWAAPPPPLGQTGWRGPPGPSRSGRSASGSASLFSLKRGRGGRRKVFQRGLGQVLPLEVATGLTWASLRQRRGVLDEVWCRDWSDFFSHWKENGKKSLELRKHKHGCNSANFRGTVLS